MIDAGLALAGLLERERETLLAEWRQKVRSLPAAARLNVPTLNDHVPKLLDKLAEALRHPDRGLPHPSTPLEQDDVSVEHGIQREQVGYDIGEVVAEYSMLRGCIHTLALIHGIPLRDGQVHTLNALLDRAIGAAVQAFVAHCDKVERQRREEHLSFVAHDLRTPLHAVVLATRVLEQNGLADDERQRMIGVLKRNVRQLSGLVENVLERNGNQLPSDFQRKPMRRPVQLWPLVEELVGDLRATAGSARLVNEVSDDLVVQADAAMLRRVLQGLIAGMLEGEHAVHVGARLLDGEQGGVSCWIGGDRAQDRADGLAQQHTAPDSGTLVLDEKKAGLDLSVVTALVEAHGGRVESMRSTNDGRPTGVRFWLPG